MLKQLLLEIDRADYLSMSALAARLGQPIGLVEEGFAALVRMGYLAEQASLTGPSCQDLPCGRCPYASMCQKDPLTMWSVTAKGRRILESYCAAG
ncbi:MAG: hypothetical protein M0R49_11245 [Limnochordia bacterium]|jgi:hypothetical protein|nr:hypothetical protein [Limnochordia bacterium]